MSTIVIPGPAKPSAASASRTASPRRCASALARPKRRPRGDRLVGAQERVAAGEQHGPLLVLGAREVERLQRPVEVLGGVLVGEPLGGTVTGAHERGGRPARVRRRRRLEQVAGDLLQVAVLAERRQRVGRAAVQAGAAEHVELVEDGVAHERMRELEAPRRRGGPQQPCAQHLVRARPRRRPGRGRRWPPARPRRARGPGSPRLPAARWRPRSGARAGRRRRGGHSAARPRSRSRPGRAAPPRRRTRCRPCAHGCAPPARRRRAGRGPARRPPPARGPRERCAPARARRARRSAASAAPARCRGRCRRP